MDDTVWTEKHEAESQFQLRKRLRRAMDAYGEGSMLPQEIAQEFGSEELAGMIVRARDSTDARSRAAYKRKQDRQRAMDAARPEVIAQFLAGKRLYIDSSSRATISNAVLDRRMATLGLQVVGNREDAECFLVVDVTKPGQRIAWNAALVGGSLMSVPFFLTGHGPVITFNMALRTRRKVWLSAGFHAAHPPLLGIVLRRVAGPGVRWALIPERDQFLASKRPGRRNCAEWLAFVTNAEVADPQLAFAKRLTALTALQFLSVVRRDVSSLGVCSR